ncbi:MAG: hypothetical protein HQ503_02140 [Rhodospirillales bacterium]|nr:hypothetical protein [Rhodospirillales bacterium]
MNASTEMAHAGPGAMLEKIFWGTPLRAKVTAGLSILILWQVGNDHFRRFLFYRYQCAGRRPFGTTGISGSLQSLPGAGALALALFGLLFELTMNGVMRRYFPWYRREGRGE